MLNRIVLIDDSEGEALLVKQMLRESGFSEPIYWIQHAATALAYLDGDGEFADRTRFPIPEVILLDLGMPEIDGYQVLRWMRSQPKLKQIIVVVLTGEMDPKRIQLAYQLGANSFLAKSAGAEEFRNFVDFVRTYSHLSNALPQPTALKFPTIQPEAVKDPVPSADAGSERRTAASSEEAAG